MQVVLNCVVPYADCELVSWLPPLWRCKYVCVLVGRVLWSVLWSVFSVCGTSLDQTCPHWVLRMSAVGITSRSGSTTERLESTTKDFQNIGRLLQSFLIWGLLLPGPTGCILEHVAAKMTKPDTRQLWVLAQATVARIQAAWRWTHGWQQNSYGAVLCFTVEKSLL